MQRWIILFALTLARTAMAFQFQSIAALAMQISDATGLSFAGIGTLSGAFLLPGVIAALLGGWAGQRFGDSRVAFFGLMLMAAGAASGAVVASFEAQLASRVIAGIGAVALNVMLNKMAGDWFEGRADLPVAMSILVSSWPAGLAFAVLLLPMMTQSLSLMAVLWTPAALSAVAFIILLLFWRAPKPVTVSAASMDRPVLTQHELTLVLTAGLIWGVYNVGFIAAISWSPLKLQELGVNPQEASAIASLVGWIAIFSVAAGGWLARALRKPDLAALGCFVLSAIGMIGVAFHQEPSQLLLMFVGLVLGPAAGMIMTLPIEATRANVRATALGVYWAVYYAAMGVGPTLLGMAREASDSADTPLLIAAGTMLCCVVLWLVFRSLQSRFTASSV